MTELQVLISQKGTRVVTATNLHQVLQLLDHHYATNVKKWLQDVYEFRDGIRKPTHLQDFAPRKKKDASIVEDYYLSVELAKHIALRSNSKLKLKYARYLLSFEEPEGLEKTEVLAVPDLVRAMCSISYQENCERRHLQWYETRQGGHAANWWQHRAEIMGYSTAQLREIAQQQGKNPGGKSQRQLLMQIDKYELIRAGVIDLLVSMGKSEGYARTLGDVAKAFAEEMQVELYDDRDPATLFAPETAPEPLRAMHRVEEAFRLSA